MTILKKFLITIMVVVVGTNAAVITYQKTFNDVKVISPAKSTQTTCKTRVDLSEGLVDNSMGCDIKAIDVWNKNDMWIGAINDIEAGKHKRFQDYYSNYLDDDRYKGKGTHIAIDYSFIPQDAGPYNSWRVDCPKGMIKYIDDEYYRCKKPFACSNGKYAIDSLECEILPEGAHRNVTTGYSCNKGFVMVDGYCEEKAKCDVNDAYDKTENICHKRPGNSHWINNTFEWECDDGYVLQNDVCEEKAKCDSASRYYAEKNTCNALPEFAHWNDSLSTYWSCDTGYVFYIADCVERATCSSEQRYEENTNRCIDPYPNSSWTGNNDKYECNDGYVDMGYGRCEVKAVCVDYHYDESNNSCYAKPEHSHWLSTFGSEWECDDGYNHVLSDNTCIKCGEDEQFNLSLDNCSAKPANAYWLGNGVWACNDGYWSNGYSCEEKASCVWYKRYNEINNTCVSKPSHSHWMITREWEYICDDGYVEISGECRRNKSLYPDDYNDFFHSLTFIIGSRTKEKDSVTTELFNSVLEYNIGFRIGTEFLNMRPQVMIGLLYSSFGYDKDFYNLPGESHLEGGAYFTSLVAGFSVGADIWHFTFDYSRLYANRKRRDNVVFSSGFHQFKVGYNLNEHWNINIDFIIQPIEIINVFEKYYNTSYNIGVSYAF